MYWLKKGNSVFRRRMKFSKLRYGWQAERRKLTSSWCSSRSHCNTVLILVATAKIFEPEGIVLFELPVALVRSLWSEIRLEDKTFLAPYFGWETHPIRRRWTKSYTTVEQILRIKKNITKVSLHLENSRHAAHSRPKELRPCSCLALSSSMGYYFINYRRRISLCCSWLSSEQRLGVWKSTYLVVNDDNSIQRT